MRITTTLRMGTVVLVLVAGGVLGACSNSNSFAKACKAEAKVEDLTSALPTPDRGQQATAADKAKLKAAFPPTAKALDQLDGALPEHPKVVTDALKTLRSVGKDGDPAILDNFDGDTFAAYFYGHCSSDQERPITAKEYEYDGGTAPLHAGAFRVKLHNGGTQIHEMLLLKVKDGSHPTKAQIEALAGAGDSALGAKFDFINAAFAPQGKDSYLASSLTKGSTYVMLCTIPVGTTSFEQLQNGTTSGPPHFARGMIRTFTVN